MEKEFKQCPLCNAGSVYHSILKIWVKCPDCTGFGMVAVEPDQAKSEETCPDCLGIGSHDNGECRIDCARCNGAGQISSGSDQAKPSETCSHDTCYECGQPVTHKQEREEPIWKGVLTKCKSCAGSGCPICYETGRVWSDMEWIDQKSTRSDEYKAAKVRKAHAIIVADLMVKGYPISAEIYRKGNMVENKILIQLFDLILEGEV